MVALTLRGFPTWILGINPSEVEGSTPEAVERIRQMIIAYQVEAVDVLYNHFSQKSRLALPESQAIVPAEPVKPAAPQQDAPHDEWITYYQQMARWHQQLQDIEIRVQQVEQRQDNTEARVGSLEKIVGSMLPHVGGLSTEHRATAQEMVKQISKISRVKPQYIWSDLKKDFHAPAYSDIPDEKWPKVQQWLQRRLDNARQGKGIEQQPSLFDESER
jgi:capsule polysaccharide export protein KpsE/RkpR